jgi:hypothetical protein
MPPALSLVSSLGFLVTINFPHKVESTSNTVQKRGNEPVDQSGLTSNPKQQKRNKLPTFQENSLTKGKLGRKVQGQLKVTLILVQSIGSR